MIITLTGKNDYLSSQDLTSLVGEFRDKYGDNSFHQFDAGEIEFDQLSEAVLSVPFLSSESMIVLREISADKGIQEPLIELLDSVPSSTTLVIYDPNLDKRTSIYKKLRAKTDFREYNLLDERQLTDWVVKKFDSKIDRNLARHLVQRVGEDQWRLSSEIDKLNNFNEKITNKLIDEVVEPHPRETIFELLDAVAQRQQSKALNLYQSLIRNQLEPNYILSMLIWQLNNLSIIVSAGRRSDNQIITDHSMSPYVLSKTKSAARNLNNKSIRKMWELIIDVDYKIKSSSVNNEQMIEQLIVKLTTF